MQVTSEDVAEFQALCREQEGVELSIAECRETLAGLFALFENFAAWIAKEKVTGREFPDHSHQQRTPSRQ